MRIKNLFKGPKYEKRGDTAYAFDGLNIALTDAIHQEKSGYSRFTVKWIAYNKDGDTKLLALSTLPRETYILVPDDITLPVTATGITLCSQSHYQQTGCKDYTTIWPGQRLTFITTASGSVQTDAIGLRARFTVHEEKQQFGPRQQPQNIDIEFQNINLSEAPWDGS